MRNFLLALAGAWALSGSPAATAQTETPPEALVNTQVLIGLIGPMSIVPGAISRDAAQFAVERINRQGLRINGKNVTLKLFIADDKNDVNLAAIDARAAVAAGVVGVIGHLTTDASMAAA